MTVSRVISILLLASLPASAAAQQADAEGDVYVSHTHGFQIGRPDDAWSFAETPNGLGGTFQVTVTQGSDWKVQVTVRVKPLAEPQEAQDILDQKLVEVAGRADCSNAAAVEWTIAGRKSPALMVDMKYRDQLFRVRQGYVVENGMVYTLQCHAPVDDFEDHGPLFDRIWRTFRILPLSDETKREQRIVALARRCGSEIEWAAGWKDAAQKARDGDRLVLVVLRFLPGFNISDDLASGPFMDPDVVELMCERFVAFRFEKGMDVPFAAQDSYGMGPSSFGSTVLLVTPAGEVVADTFTKEATSFYSFLVEHLAAHDRANALTPPDGLKGIALADWHLRRGGLDRAAELLKGLSSARAHALEASLLRRQRRGKEALRALRLARQASGKDDRVDLDRDEALILLRMGKNPEAEKLLDRIVARQPANANKPEALYWLGAAKIKTAGPEQAATVWRKLVDDHPDSRWAWKAAASLRSTAFSMGLGERLAWPAEEVLAVMRPRDFQARDASKAEQAQREALAFLLRGQRSDGSWISPAEVGRSSDEPYPFTQAITAICAQSLLPHRNQPDCEAAIRRAIRFLLSERKRERERPWFMDYTVWSKAYTLWFFADCLREGLGEPDELRTTTEALVQELRAKQRSGGGWSYYVTGDLRSAGRPNDVSISFVTAAVLASLLEARDAGIAVPEVMTDRAAACLEGGRNPNGTYEYMLPPGDTGAPRRTGRLGAAGRGPLCAVVLHRAGRAGLDDVREALDIFLEHRRSYAKEAGKTLMHAGLGGQGSHYLMFDYAFAAAAIEALPVAQRAEYRDPLLAQILGARGEDGSYIDNPIIGRHYATGMALIAFRHLRPLP